MSEVYSEISINNTSHVLRGIYWLVCTHITLKFVKEVHTFLFSWKLILAFPFTSVAAICMITASIVYALLQPCGKHKSCKSLAKHPKSSYCFETFIVILLGRKSSSIRPLSCITFLLDYALKVIGRIQEHASVYEHLQKEYLFMDSLQGKYVDACTCMPRELVKKHTLRLLPNKSPAAWGTQESHLGA